MSGPMVNLGGRKALLISDLIAILGSILFVVTNFYVAAIGRFICGLSVGIYSALCPAYISSLSPKSLRGPCGGFV